MVRPHRLRAESAVRPDCRLLHPLSLLRARPRVRDGYSSALLRDCCGWFRICGISEVGCRTECNCPLKDISISAYDNFATVTHNPRFSWIYALCTNKTVNIVSEMVLTIDVNHM